MKKEHHIHIGPFLLLLAFLVVSNLTVNAQGSVGGPVSGDGSSVGGQVAPPKTLSNPLKVDSIGEAVNVGIDIFTYIAVLVGVLMLIWTGFQFVLAQGNAAKIKDLKSWLLYIVIGIALIIGARIIIQVVLTTLESTGAVNTEVINSANNALQGK